MLVTDVFFMKFLKDYKISESESEILDTLSQVVWFALGLLILTGFALFLPTSWEYLAKTKFIAKNWPNMAIYLSIVRVFLSRFKFSLVRKRVEKSISI